MRIRILQRPPLPSIDGIRLDHFEPGRVYEVGSSVGGVLLAEQWAEPAPPVEGRPVGRVSKRKPPDPPPPADQANPPNLIREIHPPSLEGTPFKAAADISRPKNWRR
jgi:hypothetical protein